MVVRFLFVSAVVAVLSVGPAWAEAKASPLAGKLTTEAQKNSYALGLTIGRQIADMLKRNEADVLADVFAAAVQDVLAKNTPALDDAAHQAVMKALEAEATAKRQARQTALLGANRKAGQAYLEANAKKDGVKVTASGLQYKVLTPSDGPKPKATDRVKVHYRGTLLDGTEFDSSYKRGQPAEFPLNGVIRGWTEGVQLMGKGAKYQFVIPSDLAYGDRGSPPNIPPASTLIFEVELIDITTPASQPVEVKPQG